MTPHFIYVDGISIPNLSDHFIFFCPRFHFTFLFAFSLTKFQTCNVFYEWQLSIKQIIFNSEQNKYNNSISSPESRSFTRQCRIVENIDAHPQSWIGLNKLHCSHSSTIVVNACTHHVKNKKMITSDLPATQLRLLWPEYSNHYPHLGCILYHGCGLRSRRLQQCVRATSRNNLF